MKRLLPMLALTLAAATVQAQKISADNVPAAVASAFKAKFSLAEKVSWELDYDNYEAEFIMGKEQFSSNFSKDGEWLETERYIKSSKLPKATKEYMKKEFGELSAYKIDEANKVETPKGFHYEVEVTKGEKHYEIEFSEKGEFVKKEEEVAKDGDRRDEDSPKKE